MSAEDDRLVLTEYAEWRDGFQGVSRNLTVGAFLAEREARFNASRIADALTYLNEGIEYLAKVVPAHEPILTRLQHVRDILEGDRPFIEESTFTGPTTRTYL